MRVLTAFAVAVLTGLAGAIAAYFAGDWLTTLYRMSDHEGGRTLFVIFFCPPAGFVPGFWIGFTVSLRTKTGGWIGFARAVAVAFAVVVSLTAIVSGVLYVVADKPPKISGHELNFEFELKIPPASAVPEPVNEKTLRVTFYGNPSESRIAFLDYAGARRVDGALLIKGTSYMFSSRPGRLLEVDVQTSPIEPRHSTVATIGVGLPGRPGKQQEQWSEWHNALQSSNAAPVPALEQISGRWRVQEIVK